MGNENKRPRPVLAGFEAYRRTDVLTANRETILLMLYEGALRFLRGAIDALKQGDIEERNRLIIKAQEIVSELRSTLNFEAGGDLARRLDTLYGFTTKRLLQGQMESKVEPLNEALAVLETLNEAWQEAISSLKGTPANDLK